MHMHMYMYMYHRKMCCETCHLIYRASICWGLYKLVTGRFVKEQCNWDLTLYARSYTLTPCNIHVYEQKGLNSNHFS